MKPRKRTVRAHDRKIIADLKTRHYSNEEIAAFFRDNYGREMSIDTIVSDWKAVLDEWAKEVIEDVTPYMHEQLQANEQMAEHAWSRYRMAEEALDACDPQATKVRTQMFAEARYWFDRVASLRDARARLLKLDRNGISINIDNRHQVAQVQAPTPVKGYITISPDDWPSLPPEIAIPAEVGVYEEFDDEDGA